VNLREEYREQKRLKKVEEGMEKKRGRGVLYILNNKRGGRYFRFRYIMGFGLCKLHVTIIRPRLDLSYV
jgi:hypothetical protein